MHYYEDMFNSNTQSRNLQFLTALRGRVTKAMNEELTKRFTEAEVEATLHQMNLTKALGPDGMAPIFYKKILA